MIYALCLLVLGALVALFFVAGRAGFRSFGVWQTILRIVVALPLLVSGGAHLLMPASMAAAIPPVFPVRMLLVVLSGICELAGAVGLFVPAWRRMAALSIAMLMIAVFPANIYIAGQTVHGLHMPIVPVRLAMQVLYIVLVLLAGWGVPAMGSPKQRR